MPAVETSIWLALRARVASLPTDIVPQTSIAYPKKVFTPPLAGGMPLPYIEVKHLPNRVGRLFMKGSAPHVRPGILQLDYMAPVVGIDDIQATEMAGRIAAHFPADLRLYAQDVQVRIERAPDVAGGFLDGAYWRVPISVRYEALH